MANRYWVGGSGNWSSTSHWSTSSGGSSGASVPSTSDDVFIDSNSGFGSGGEISTDLVNTIHDFTSNTGHSYTISALGDFNFNGSMTLEPTLSFLPDTYWSGNTSETLNPNGCLFEGSFANFNGTGTLTLGSNMDVRGYNYGFDWENGTFDANGYNVTSYYFSFYAGTGYTPTIKMGSGIWELLDDGYDLWNIYEEDGEVVNFIPETSTIKIIGYGGSGDKYFSGGGKTYNNIWLAATESDNNFSFIINDSNTFNTFKVDNIATSIHVKFESDTTQTINSFMANGKDGDLITLTSIAGEFTLSQASGVVECNYLDISNSNATGGAAWYAGADSVDTTNNTGWIFGSPANDSRSSVSFGGDGRYVEDFSTTTKKDAGNTTASWTGDGTAEMT